MRPLRSLFAASLLASSLSLTVPARAQDSSATSTGSPAKKSVVHGVDVSDDQDEIDWPKAVRAGIGFAFVKVSDGLQHDTRFADNWAGAKAAGVVRGAYQYFRASLDGADAAKDFLDQIPADDLGDLPVSADVETLDGESAKTLATELAKWVKAVTARTGRAPMIFTTPGLWDEWRMPAFPASPLWVSHWGVAQPRIPQGWSDWSFWQYKASAKVAGIPWKVDLDEYRGTLEGLKAFALTAGRSSDASAAAAPTAPATAPPPTSIGVVGALEGAGNTPSTTSDPKLQQGDSGESVKRLQTLLNAAGASLIEDGIFGATTDQAVREFQKEHGCDTDGVVGPATWKALEASPVAPAAGDVGTGE